MARHPYPIHTIRQRQAVTEKQLEAALSSADEKQTLRGLCTYLGRQCVTGGWASGPPLSAGALSISVICFLQPCCGGSLPRLSSISICPRSQVLSAVLCPTGLPWQTTVS